MRDRRNPLLRAGAILVALLGIVSIAAPWLAPNDPAALEDPAARRVSGGR